MVDKRVGYLIDLHILRTCNNFMLRNIVRKKIAAPTIDTVARWETGRDYTEPRDEIISFLSFYTSSVVVPILYLESLLLLTGSLIPRPSITRRTLYITYKV